MNPAEDMPTWYREMRELYRELDELIEPEQHRCELRGICCDFENADHMLFASTIEVLFANASRPHHVNDDPKLCPFWQHGRCHAREERPIGCRTYFCDPTWQDRGQRIYERFLARARRIANSAGVDYQYRPWPEVVRETSPSFTIDRTEGET